LYGSKSAIVISKTISTIRDISGYLTTAEYIMSFGPKSPDITKTNIFRFMKKYDINSYDELLEKSTQDIDWYWNAVNEDLGLRWFGSYDKVVDISPKNSNRDSRWFVNGKCNIIHNAIDRNLKYCPGKIAYIFENENGFVTKVTYEELNMHVNAVAAALKSLGLRKGDVIGIYLPMIPEAIYCILACSKIGAIHNVIFSGFGSYALQSRLTDSNAKILITSNKMIRRGRIIDLENKWLKAVEKSKVTTIISVDGFEPHSDNRLIGYSELLQCTREASCDTEIMDSEDPLFILYTSGTTGIPKGTVHVHGGFMVVSAQQTAYTIDMTKRDVLFWYADIGWITCQTWVIYGSPIVGGTAVIYDGVLTYPTPYKWCELIDKHRVSIFGIAPTAIRQFMREDKFVNNFAFSSLRILTTTGEPIDEKTWLWYRKNVGKDSCSIINLSGGTEIGGAIVSSSMFMPDRPCSVGKPLPGFDAAVLDEFGNDTNQGCLVIRKPWPSMTRGILNDNKRFIDTYWSKYPNIWHHGDIVYIDTDGFWYILGRDDDVIKVSGHRIGSFEIENAIMRHNAVSECIVTAVPDDISGQSILAYVILKNRTSDQSLLRNEIISQVENTIGKFACPRFVKFVEDFPRTKTGKLLRRIVKLKMNGDLNSQDLASVDNPESIIEL
jgi:acetyl-CoA synthetase